MATSYSQVPKDEVFEMTDIPEGGVYIDLWIAPCLTTPLVPPSGDPSDKTWSMYLSESEKHDKAISDGWKDDANGVLVFVRISPSFYDLSLMNKR